MIELSNTLVSADWLVLADHIVATTPMDTSNAHRVVDGNLNVFGVKNLMISDIGVLLVIPNGNTAYAAYLVGLRCATILGAKATPASESIHFRGHRSTVLVIPAVYLP